MKPELEWAVCIKREYGFVPHFWRRTFPDAVALARTYKAAHPWQEVCISRRSDGAELMEFEERVNRCNARLRELRCQINQTDRDLVNALSEVTMLAAERGWKLETRLRENGQLKFEVVGRWDSGDNNVN